MKQDGPTSILSLDFQLKLGDRSSLSFSVMIYIQCEAESPTSKTDQE